MHSMPTTPKTLTDHEVRTLLAVTGRAERDLRDHVLLLVAVSTGLRVSELVGLNVGDLRNGKGVKAIVTLRPETTKGKREGEVVLPEKVRRKVAAFLTWKERRAEPTENEAPLPDEHVQCVVTSPPFYRLRRFGVVAWLGGRDDCAHANAADDTCPGCGAWHGELGWEESSQS